MKQLTKELISKIYMLHTQLNITKISSSIKKLAEAVNRHFSKEDSQVINKHKILNINNY